MRRSKSDKNTFGVRMYNSAVLDPYQHVTSIGIGRILTLRLYRAVPIQGS